jgi:hypothetical protein
MTDTTQPFTPPTAPTRQALEAVNRSYPGKVTGRLRAALLDRNSSGNLAIFTAIRRTSRAKAALGRMYGERGLN